MYLRDVFSSLGRRWYLVVLAVLATAAICATLFTRIEPVYSGKASVVLVPPKVGNDQSYNQFLNLGDLAGTVDVLARSMSSDATVSALREQQPDATFAVSSEATTSAPVLSVTTSSTSSTAALDLVGDVLAEMRSELGSLQSEVGVTGANRITMVTLARSQEAQADNSGRIRPVGAAAVGLLAVFALLIAAVDGLLVRRRRRREQAPAAAKGRSTSNGKAAKAAKAARGKQGGNGHRPDTSARPGSERGRQQVRQDG